MDEEELEPMTVKRLVWELTKYPPDMLVSIEGCDCIGDALGAEPMDSVRGERLLITRMPD